MSKKLINQEDFKEYPHVCPKCKKDDFLSFSSFDTFENFISQNVTCERCKITFNVQYECTGYEIIE